MTRGDRIRAMSNKELAEWMSGLIEDVLEYGSLVIHDPKRLEKSLSEEPEETLKEKLERLYGPQREIPPLDER